MKSKILHPIYRQNPSKIQLWVLYYPLTFLLVGLSLFAQLWLESQYPFLLMYPTVMIASWWGGLKFGLLAACLGTFSSVFIMVQEGPRLELSDLLAVGIFFCLATSVAFAIHLAQKSLEEVQSRLAILVDGSTEFIGILDAHGDFSYLNVKAKNLTGTSIEVGSRLDELLLSESANEGLSPVTIENLENRIQQNSRFFVRNISLGSTSPIGLQLRELPIGQSSDRYRWALIGRDLSTEIETDEKLSAALNISALAVWELNFISKSFKRSENHDRLFGLESHLNLPVGSILKRVKLSDRLKIIKDLRERLRSKDKLFYWDYEVIWEDGKRAWLSSRGSIFYGLRGRPIKLVGGTVDITKEKLAEIELSRAVKIRDEFVSIASHELKTPVTSLLLHLELLKGELELDREQREFLDQATQQAKKLVKLTNSLLDTAKVASGKIDLNMETLKPLPFIKNVVDGFQKMNPDEHYLIDADHFREDANISIDPMRLDQILTNLLSNATKFGNHKPIKVKLSSLDDRLLIEVINQSKGISKDKQRGIFDRFSQLESKRSRGGLGLGLHISKVLTEVQGGQLSVTSTPKKGSSFSLSFKVDSAHS